MQLSRRNEHRIVLPHGKTRSRDIDVAPPGDNVRKLIKMLMRVLFTEKGAVVGKMMRDIDFQVGNTPQDDGREIHIALLIFPMRRAWHSDVRDCYFIAHLYYQVRPWVMEIFT